MKERPSAVVNGLLLADKVMGIKNGRKIEISFPSGDGDGEDFSLEILVNGASTVGEALIKINSALAAVVKGSTADEILQVIRAIESRIQNQEEWGV